MLWLAAELANRKTRKLFFEPDVLSGDLGDNLAHAADLALHLLGALIRFGNVGLGSALPIEASHGSREEQLLPGIEVAWTDSVLAANLTDAGLGRQLLFHDPKFFLWRETPTGATLFLFHPVLLDTVAVT